MFKTESEETFDVIRWLDRMLIRLMNKFAGETIDINDFNFVRLQKR